MIKEIQAKTILSKVPQPDSWFGLTYVMNLYRGCQHQCIYCDSRSKCYRIENFADVLVKKNAIDLLERELSSKRLKGTIGTGSMNDPYMPVEREIRLTERALKVIADYRYPVHILTKSDLVLRDLSIIKHICQVYSAVSFTITTWVDELAGKIEPSAPSPSRRFEAIEKLAKNGIYTGVLMMPLLPFIEDHKDNIKGIIERAADSGAGYIIPGFGVTLRDRQRDFLYKKLDVHFPGLSERYRKTFGEKYFCEVNDMAELKLHFTDLCQRYKLSTKMIPFKLMKPKQLELF